MSSRPVQIVAGVVVALVLFTAGFFAGTGRAQASTSGPVASAAAAAGGRGAFGGTGAAGAAANRNVVNGQILSVNADSITIQIRSAGQPGASPGVSSQLILVGPTTRVVKTAETDVKLSDLKAGDQITVAGAPDATTGSVSAQAIVLGANNVLADLLGGGGARRGATPSPSPTR